MTDKPILFSASMIRALLDGRKTQTRRVLNDKQVKRVADIPSEELESLQIEGWDISDGTEECLGEYLFKTPIYAGDRLWVRESFQVSGIGWGKKPKDAHGGKVHFMADPDHGWQDYWGGWHPSIHMPRWASRLTLVVTDVRVQRVQEISEADAIAEGIFESDVNMYPELGTARHHFEDLWDSLNSKRGFGWDDNPWVTAITFTVHRCNIDQMEAA